VKATFRVQGVHVERWDPFTGRVTRENAESLADGTSVALDLEAYGSRIFVLTKRTLPVRPAAGSEGGLPPAIELSGGWSVRFGNDAQTVCMDKLRSWTETENTRYFSGVATYEKRVTVPAQMLDDGLVVRVDFGPSKPVAADARRAHVEVWLDAPVREAAVVYVNGKRAGSAWCPPYGVELSGLLKPGENEIRIEVANLAVNYMADFARRPLPNYAALIARYGNRFQPQEMNLIQPVPAGLMGPIRIIATKP
jgi:hypothetical protein